MDLRVVVTSDGHRLSGDGSFCDLANAYLAHLRARNFASATVRAYAFDLLNFGRYLAEREDDVQELGPADLFDWLDWQVKRRKATGKVVRLADSRGASPATMNRRVAAVRGLFEFAVMTGDRATNPVPRRRRSTGFRAPRGLLGHLGPRHPRGDGRLVRQDRRLPESIDIAEVGNFIGDLETHRDKAVALAMVLGGLRAAEVRGLLLANVDMGMRQLRVLGKGNKERTVPVDSDFFGELGAYLRTERPASCGTPECFVVLRGPTRGQPMSEAGMRKIFRSHRATSGATRVRPHRLRHTYGTELAAAGIDLLALKELMGHAHPETTAAYVHLSSETLAAEYARAREAAR